MRRIGFAKPDGWKIGGMVFVDDTMPEPFNVRIETSNGVTPDVAVRIEVTGKVTDREGFVRCRIVFLGDGEPDVPTKGKVLLANK